MMTGQVAARAERVRPRARILLVGVYLVVGVALTSTCQVVESRNDLDTGLLRALYRGPGRERPPIQQDVTPNIDLSFIDENPLLPKRFFSVRWTGIWYVSQEQEVDIYCGADDSAVVRIDGDVVIRRNIVSGLHTTFERVHLDAGLHRLSVYFEQHRGDSRLNVQWAPAGQRPRRFDAESLFPRRPSDRQLRDHQRLAELRKWSAVAWVFPPLLLLTWLVAPRVARAVERHVRSWFSEGLRNLRTPTVSLLAKAKVGKPRTSWILWLVYVAALVTFAVSILSFYNSGTGFTSLIRFGDQFQEQALPAIQEAPHFVEENSFGYDGQWYAQLAVTPLLRAPGLRHALDSAPYRSRRILFSWTAFILGLGQPRWILEVYALQNVVAWFLLSWLVLRWLPPVDLRNLVCWGGCLFSYGLVSSVTSSLTDGPSLLLILLGIAAIERQRVVTACVVFGFSGLARYTNLLGAAAFAQSSIWRRRGPFRQLVMVVAVAAPLLLWWFYLTWVFGSPSLGATGNLQPPLTGYLQKWIVTTTELEAAGWTGPFKYSLFALVSLTVQVLYLASRTAWHEPWWRVGVTYGVLMIFLGDIVWAGYPGSAARILLPMTFAFNLCLPAYSPRRWFWPLCILGNLTVIQTVAELNF